MAKKKISKKTKYTLLGLGLVGVGVGYYLAKKYKVISGIGAIGGRPKYKFPIHYRGAVIKYMPIIKDKPLFVEYGEYSDRYYFAVPAKNVKAAKQMIDSWLEKLNNKLIII